MKWLIRSEELPSEYGEYPGSRPIEELLKNGVVLLDKWAGPTSNDVTSTVRKTLGATKSGHSGTLDPQVTGVLPITLGNSCKIMPALQKLDKEYVGVMHLHKDVSLTKVKQISKEFIGKIKQTPPLRSAVKRRERERKVHSFEILGKVKRDVAFRISCEAGTYIRMICHDIGKKIGGAHMKELRRTKVGNYSENRLVKMEKIENLFNLWKEKKSEEIREFVLPPESAIENIKKIIVRNSAVFSLLNGSPLYSQGISKIEEGIEKGEIIAVLTIKGELIALAKSNITSQEMKSKKFMAAKIDRVIMKKGLYPKIN